MATSVTPFVSVELLKVVGQLKRDEGYRQHPYTDTVGVLTIGYGFNLLSDGLSEDESAMVLQVRAWKRYLELLKALPWLKTLDEVRQGVLVNMAYNLGVTGLLGFGKMLQCVILGRYADAAVDMLDSRWAEQVGDRAKRLAEQMRTGVWQ